MRFSKIIRAIVKEALEEDIGRCDITTIYTVPPHIQGKAVIIAKESGLLCGIKVVRAVFKELDKHIIFKSLKNDGEVFQKNEQIASISGRYFAILSAERVALNFLSLLSGIATLTRAFVNAVRGTSTKIMDTRKTTPNLRILEKYAVRLGGGHNHRKSLEEEILVKDNHLRAGSFIRQGKINEGKIEELIKAAKASSLRIEIEVEALHEFKSIIKYKPDVIMLDNFSIAHTRKAVEFRNSNFAGVKLEASGGISLKDVAAVAKSGVDFISVGSITHSPKAIDFSLEILDK